MPNWCARDGFDTTAALAIGVEVPEVIGSSTVNRCFGRGVAAKSSGMAAIFCVGPAPSDRGAAISPGATINY